MSLDGIFAYALRMELGSVLLSGRVEKINQPEQDEIVLIIRAGRESHRLLFTCNPSSVRVHITKAQKENPLSAPMFCMLLRKHLTGARLIKIEQQGVERALSFVFEAYDEMGYKTQKTLVIEIMGRFSNIIFIDPQGLVVDSIRRVDITTSSKRQILPRLKYSLPPGQDKLDPLFCTKDQVRGLFLAAQGSEKTEQILLEGVSGLSPLVSRELCHRAGVLGKRLCELDDGETGELIEKVMLHLLKIREADFSPRLLCDTKTGRPLYFSYTQIDQYGGAALSTEVGSLSSLLDEYYLKRDEMERMRQRGAHLMKIITNHTQRGTKKLDLLSRELLEAKDREHFKIYGDLITANIYRINHGDESVTAENYYSPEGEAITIPLDKSLSPAHNAQKYFKEYRRRKTAQGYIEEQLEKTLRELLYLDSVSDALTRSKGDTELLEISRELASQGYNSDKNKDPREQRRQKQKKARSVSISEYTSPGGIKIMWGRNNLQNDYLTFELSKKEYIWLHVKDLPGSHVVICAGEGEADDQTIYIAACIAAKNSKAVDGGKVRVDYTQIKNVKRIPGGRPGMVYYVKQRTITAQPKDAPGN